MSFPSQSQRAPNRGFKRRSISQRGPLQSTELMDAATSLYRQGGFELLRNLLIPATIAFGLLAISYHLFFSKLFSPSATESAVAQAQEVVSSMFLATTLALPPIFLSLSYMAAFVSLYASDLHLGLRPNTLAIGTTILRKLPRLAALNFILFLRTFIGVIFTAALLLTSAVLTDMYAGQDSIAPLLSFLGVVGILCSPIVALFFASRDSLAPIVLMHESAGITSALKRSQYLTTARSMRRSGSFLGLVVICIIFYFIIWLGLGIPVDYLQEFLQTQGVDTSGFLARTAYQMVASLDVFVAFLLVLPIFICGQTIIYFERRTHLEGYDIELLAQEVWKHARQVEFDV